MNTEYQERIGNALDKKVLEWRERGEVWTDITHDLLPIEIERALRATARVTAAHEPESKLFVGQRIEAGIEALENEELEKP